MSCGYEYSQRKSDGLVYVYFIRCNDGSIYTGVSNNVYRRYEQHRMGKGAKYTKIKGVNELITYRKFANRSEALKIEYHIKSLTTEKKRQLIRTWKNENLNCDPKV